MAKREAEGGKQCLGFVVSLSGSGDADVHTTYGVDFVVFDFRENDLLFHPDVVVATSIECTTRNTTEVANARQSHDDQAVQEFVHALATQGNQIGRASWRERVCQYV